MLGALGTLFLFSITAVFASQAAARWGSLRANALRLSLAVFILGIWAHGLGLGLGGAGLPWFFLSGLAGFGVGGVSMFLSLARLGPSLSMLVVQCGSVVVAVGLEWLWLDQALKVSQLGYAILVMAGVSWGLAPSVWPHLARGVWLSGVSWALCSALGQGAGAVLSRKAFAAARMAGEAPDPASAAYQRALAGCLFALIVFLIAWKLGLERQGQTGPLCGGKAGCHDRRAEWRGYWYVFANALTGPVLGVTCYQWALRSTPAGIVQPVVAASPLLTIPLAVWLGRTSWPGRRYYPGLLLAIGGVIGLYLSL